MSNLHLCLRGHFVHVQLGSHFQSWPSRRQPLVRHSGLIYLDFSSFRGIALQACRLYDETVLHEVYHRRRRASSTPASAVIQDDLVTILQAAGVCAPPHCATTQPHSSAISPDERTLLRVLLSQQHLRDIINNPAQGDAERSSQFGLEGEELANACRCFRGFVSVSCQVRGSGLYHPAQRRTWSHCSGRCE